MKKLLALSVAIVIGTSLLAQTGADSRLIASVMSEYHDKDSVFVPVDSTSLTYTGNNGWDYATNNWKYDSLRVWTPVPFSSAWSEDKHHVQQMMNDRIATRLSADYWGAGWQDLEKTDYTYVNGLVVQKQVNEMGNGTYVPHSREVITYDPHGLEIENLLQATYGNPYWTNEWRTIRHYNFAKQNDTVQDQKWSFSDKKWVDQYRNIFIYSNGRLTETVFQWPDSNGWRNNNRKVYVYLKNKCIGMSYEQWGGVNSWIKESMGEYDYDASGNMIEEIGSFWIANKCKPFLRYLRTYDEFHRVVTEETQYWHWTENKWYYSSGNHRIRNYYETYTNDVKTVATKRADLKVFPVPAKEQITISASFQQMQPVSIIIMDMNGRVVKQLADQAGTQYRKTINVADLPAGSYMINISGTTEVASKMISVTR